MIADPILALQSAVADYLQANGSKTIVLEPSLAPEVRWRPQVYDSEQKCGWHVVTEIPINDLWKKRIAATVAVVSPLRVGLAGPESVLATPEVIDSADELGVALLVAEQDGETFRVTDYYATTSEFIIERQMQLGPALALQLLDRGLQRAIQEPNEQRKGVLLELVAALMFSQVNGFEVISRGISRRSQQVDIAIHNRNVGGVLGGSPVVLGEVKNWTRSVGPKEYAWLWRKMAASNGRAKLGFFVTTDRFTRGVYTEAARDTMMDALIVLLDAESFPGIWRNHTDVTRGIEKMVMNALEDQRQRLLSDSD